MNQRLTQITPGTPMGNLLRRYWHPVAGASEFDRKALKPVRFFGEDLVLFRGESGTYGLIPRRCQHRGADLSFGFVEDDGVRCHYHGWKYDCSGACVDRPFDSNVNPGRKVPGRPGPGYLAREKAGLVWIYMGPQAAPELPDWDAFGWPNTFKQIVSTEVPCNWLQCQENTVDPVHFEWLHNNTQQRHLGDKGPYSPRTLKMSVEDTPFGLLSRRYREGTDETAPLWSVGRAILWPNGWFFGHHLEWKVPIDDTNTLFVIWFALRVPREHEPYVQASIPTWHAPIKDEQGQWLQNSVSNQDIVAWISQGPIADRSKESLAASDVGVVALRRRLMDDMEAVENGRDPRCIIRDPAANKALELPCIDLEAYRDGLPLAEMKSNFMINSLLQDFYIFAGQPPEVRKAFEDAMHVKMSSFDIHSMVQK
jgi:5,5'-dehydrodivanillate O-demethylase oxygenase subunit